MPEPAPPPSPPSKTLSKHPPTKTTSGSTPGTLNALFPDFDITSAIALDRDGTLYFGIWPDGLVAMDPDGSPRWTLETEGQVSWGPVVSLSGRIFAATSEGVVYSVRRGGVVEWERSLCDGRRAYGPALGAGDHLYIACELGGLYRLQPEGGEVLGYFDVEGAELRTAPVIDEEGRIYQASTQGSLYALYPDLEVRWSYGGTGGFGSPVLDGQGRIITTVRGERLLALDRDGGFLTWSFHLEEGAYFTSPPVVDEAGGVIVATGWHDPAFSDYEYHLRRFAADGHLLWQSPEGRQISASPLVGQGGIVYTVNRGLPSISHPATVSALEVGTGAALWTYSASIDTSTRTTHTTLSDQGLLFFGAREGLYAINTGSPGLAHSAWPKFGRDRTLTANALFSDDDGDGMVDQWEEDVGLDPFDGQDGGQDPDADGLTNAQEYTHYTDPFSTDTDADGVSDAGELGSHGTEPTEADTDGDGRDDGDELFGDPPTDPLDPDMDADGMPDGWELSHGLDPLVDDSELDADGDGKSNRLEYLGASDPQNAGSLPAPGQVLWHLGGLEGDVGQPPALGADGTLYFQDGDASVYAVSPYGEVQWTSDLGLFLELGTPAVGDGGEIYVSGELAVSLNSDGTTRWWGPDFDAYFFGTSPGLGPDGTVYIVSLWYGFAVALDGATGALRWESEPLGWFCSDPVVGWDGTVYVNCPNVETVFALDGESGDVLWTYATPGSELSDAASPPPLIGQDGTLYVPTRYGGLHAIHPDGTPRWVKTPTTRELLVAPVLSPDGILYLGDLSGETWEEGSLMALDALSGDVLWRTELEGGVYAPPAIAQDGSVLVASAEEGCLQSVAPSGVLQWTLCSELTPFGSPTIAPDGTVYVKGSYGDLLAVSDNNGGLAASNGPKGRGDRSNRGGLRDDDGDGLPRWWEQRHGLSDQDAADASLDLDGDGLDNSEELANYGDPNASDTDGDGLSDGEEAAVYQTSLARADTDGDGLPDGWEVAVGLDASDSAGAQGAEGDPDGDGLSNAAEYDLGTDPLAEDSDGDGLTDGVEVATGTDPADPDSDGDGIPDGADAAPLDAGRDGWALGSMAASGAWSPVTLDETSPEGVIITGVPGNADPERGVLRLKGIEDDQPEVRFQEWDDLDGAHAEEALFLLGAQRGRYVFPEGEVIEVGILSLGGTGQWEDVAFSAPFPGDPAVFVSLQSYNGSQAAAPRIRAVSGVGFEISLMEQERFMGSGHNPETVAFLALYAPSAAGTLPLGEGGMSYRLDAYDIDHRWTGVGGGAALRLEEEASADPEVEHVLEEVSVLSLGGGVFAQAQTTNGLDPAVLRLYRRDGAAYGAFEVGEAQVGDGWSDIPFAAPFAQPVVIAGPPTDHDPEPGLLRLREVGAESFSWRFQEWDYLDGVHLQLEDASYMVWEAGRHALSDGSTVEVGTFAHAGTEVWREVLFQEAFTTPPQVFLTVQTYNGAQAVVARVQDISDAGFSAALFEQQSYMGSGHNEEVVGYLALSTPTPGTLWEGGAMTGDWHILRQEISVDDRYTPVLSEALRLEEERSADDEVAHVEEGLSVLAVEAHVFAQSSTGAGLDPFGLRRRAPELEAMGEWGIVHHVGSDALRIPFRQGYERPVIVARPLSATRAEAVAGVPRLEITDDDGFWLRFTPWDEGSFGADQSLFYLVVEEGVGELGGLAYEAGSLSASGSLSPGDVEGSPWTPVAFDAPFQTAPLLWTSILSAEDPVPVTLRARDLGPAGFDVIMQESELRSSSGEQHGGEALGWVAMAPGQGQTESGRLLWTTGVSAGDQGVRVACPGPVDAALTTMLGDLNSTRGSDAATSRLVAPEGCAVYLGVQEEQTVTEETSHLSEDLSLFMAE